MFDFFYFLNFIKKHIRKIDIFIIFILILFFFITRLINLENFPIFTDEGIYIRWAKTAWHDASWRFISLTDGRQPLQTWVTILFLKAFPENPLFAGRLFGVLSGFGSLIGLFLLSLYIFDKKAAYFISLFYIIAPMFIFYDRMALADSAVNMSFIWMLFFSIVLIKTMRFDIAFIFGFCAGFFLLIKSTPKIFLICSAFAPILIFKRDLREWIKKSVNYCLIFTFVLFLSTIIYNVQRLSPFFINVAKKNTTFVLTLAEFLENPFKLFLNNLTIIPYYFLSEMGYFVGLLGIVGLFFMYKKNRLLAVYIFLWFIIPFLIICSISKVVFPRYLIFFGTILCLLAGYYISLQRENKKSLILIFCVVLSVLHFDYTILFSPANIPFPSVDRGQYITGISSGWGAKEIIDFARDKSGQRQVILIAEGNFGVIGDMLEALKKQSDTRILVKGYWPLEKENLIENQKLLTENFVYVVFSHRNEFPSDWPIRFISEFKKPFGENSVYLFELLK